jgi:hypothetical protein
VWPNLFLIFDCPFHFLYNWFDSSASSDVDFDDYGEFGYQLEPEYTEEELRQMEEAASAQRRENFPTGIRFKLQSSERFKWSEFNISDPDFKFQSHNAFLV